MASYCSNDEFGNIWLLVVLVLLFSQGNIFHPSNFLLIMDFFQIVCRVTSALTITLMTFTIVSMCHGTLGQLSSDPSGLFVCFELISFLYLVVTIYAIGWTLGAKFETLLQSETNLNMGNNRKYRDWRKLLSPQNCWILASLLYTVNRIGEFADSAITSNGYFSKFSERFDRHALFFLSSETKKMLWHPYLNILCIVAFTSIRIVRMFGTILVFAGITLHGCAVREFTGRIKQFGIWRKLINLVCWSLIFSNWLLIACRISGHI